MKKILSLKLSTNSIGYCVLREKHDKLDIIKTGVHLFTAAENPKTKGSLNLQRSEAKVARVRRKRQVQRKEAIKTILEKTFLKDALPHYTPLKRVWILRAISLDIPLTHNELLNVIFHLNSRRGYMAFTRNINTEDAAVTGRILEALSANRKMLEEGHYRTFGEMMQGNHVTRNKGGDYKNIPHRDWIRSEFQKIMEAQKRFHTVTEEPFFSEEQIKDLEKKIFEQRPLKNSISKIGKCSFFPCEDYVSKNHPLAIQFSLLSLLLSANFYDSDTNTSYNFDEEHLRTLLEKFEEKGKIGIKDIKSVFRLKKDVKLKSRKNLTGTFFDSRNYVLLRDILGAVYPYFMQHPQKMEELVRAISFYYSPEEIKHQLQMGAFSDFKGDGRTIIDELSELTSFTGTLKISLKALELILPYMKKGTNFKDALEHVRFLKLLPMDSSYQTLKKLPPFDDMLNDVVNRTLAQTRKIINNINLKYGKIDAIHLETGRELGKTPFQRKKIQQNIKANLDEKSEVMTLLEENNFKQNPESVLLMRVWKQQNETDFLTGEEISFDDIANNLVTVIPICEKSINRSFSNMMVTFKNNLLMKHELLVSLYERLNNEENPTMHPAKIRSLNNYMEQNANQYSLKPKQDWILSALREHLVKYMHDIEFITVPSGILPFVKSIWSVSVDQLLSYQIPVQEALVVGAIQKQTIKKIKNYLEKDSESYLTLDFPFDRNEFTLKVKNSYPTVMPHRKMSGEAHSYKIMRSLTPLNDISTGERITYPKFLEREEGTLETKILKRISLSEITPKNFQLIWNFEKDPELKTILKTRLDEFKWDATKAFAEPIYIKNKKNNLDVLVRNVRIYDDSRCVVKLRGGVVNYSSMICVNIYKYDHEFLGSPIYAFDILKLKNNTNIAKQNNLPLPVFPTTYIDGRSEKPIEPNAHFCGRLYSGDFVRIVKKFKIGEEKVGTLHIEGYFRSYNRSTNAMALAHIRELKYDGDELISENRVEEPTSFSILKAFNIEFFHVDILGKITPKTPNNLPLVNVR